MRFCEKLAVKRKQNNLSQEQFADTLGVSRQAVSKWESGTSYPDMDKIIKMTKILNCTLEDLLDDGTIGKNRRKEKTKITDQFQQVLNQITKTYNMFFSMTLKQKLKCVLEMFCLAIMLLLIGGIITTILIEITYNMLTFIPNPTIVHAIEKIFESIYTVIAIIFGVIVFIHIFKIRYLDYYITIEDDNTKTKKIEQSLEIKEKDRERIIIRDPKHSTTHIINVIGKILILFLKILIIWFIIPVVFAFIFFVVLASICICHINIGLIFSTGFLLFAAISFLCFLLIYLTYNFVFNRKQHMKFIFISMISSFLIIGISIGLSVTILLNYKQIDGTKGLDRKTSTEIINVNENTTITFGMDNDEDNIEYIIDNSKSDIELEIQTVKGVNYVLNKAHNDYYYLNMREIPPKTIYNIFLNDIKNRQIRNYNSNEFLKVKVILSKNNYDLLKNNHEKFESQN